MCRALRWKELSYNLMHAYFLESFKLFFLSHFQADPTTLDFEIQLRDYLMAFIEDRDCPGDCTIDFSVASGYGDVAKGMYMYVPIISSDLAFI